VERARPRLPWTEIGLTLAGIALLAAVVLLVPELRRACEAAIQGDSTEVRRQIDGLGIGGELLILAMALALVTLGWMASALLCYAFGRSVARPLLDRWFGAERFERLEGMIERGGVTLLLAVRLIPIVPFSLAGYAAGAARVPLWRFFWTTLVGYMPITALAVYFGTRLEGLSLTDPVVFGSALVVIALLALGHWIVRRQASREAAAAAGSEPVAGAEPVASAEQVAGSERVSDSERP
jgi:membrane protein DedA with SNARE-associated domain